MNHDPFQRFLNLIQFDQDIVAKKRAVQLLQKQHDTLIENQRTQAAQFTAQQQAVAQARLVVTQQEKEMQRLTDQEKEKKDKLSFVSNTKEYQSLNAEIARIASAQHALEDSVLAAWQELDAQQRAFDKSKQAFDEHHAVVQQQQQNVSNQINGLHAELDAAETQRSSYLQDLPEEWLEKYTAMRERVADPVVPVIDGSCSACFHSLLAKDLSALKRNALLQCRSCFRFLYVPELKEGMNA